MQMCSNCDKVYDSSEYNRCPYCSGELETESDERYYKTCSNCGGTMYWAGSWECTDCGNEINTSESDNDGIIEY